MTHGFGAMQDYSAQVPVADRWAIAAYIRALQFSQRADRRRRAGRSPRAISIGPPRRRRRAASRRRRSNVASTPTYVHAAGRRYRRAALEARSSSACVGLVGCAHRLRRRSRPSLPRLADRLSAVPRHRARLAGADDDPAPVRRRSGASSGAIFEASSRTMPLLAVLFAADPARDAVALSVDAPGPRRSRSTCCVTRRRTSTRTFFIARVVIYFAGWSALATLLNKLVAAAGRRRRRRQPAHPAAERRRARALRPDRDVRRHRLDHVAQPALVLDAVRVPDDGRSGAGGAGVHHRRRDVPGASASRCTGC